MKPINLYGPSLPGARRTPRENMPTQTPRYRSFLMRCWEERSQIPDQPVIWRFSLEDVETGERLGFRDLEALVVFIQTQIARSPPDGGSDVLLNF